jgi:predicted nucleic acid-binding protein
MPLIEEFVNLATVLQLDSVITKKAIEIRRKHRKLKLGDAIISATAIIHNLILITNNVKDFANIKDLKIIDPHNL